MSLKHPVLAQLALGFSPLYDKQRQVLATRVSCIPLKPDAAIDVAALWVALGEAIPTNQLCCACRKKPRYRLCWRKPCPPTGRWKFLPSWPLG